MLGHRRVVAALLVALAGPSLLGVGGCTAALRTEVAVLREQVGKLRDDVEALKDAVQGGPRAAEAEHPRQRVTVIGQRGDALNVTVTPHAVLVNGELVKEEELADHLSQLVNGNPELRAIVAADRQTSHARVVAMMDALKQAGIKRVSLAVQRAPR